MMQSPDRRSRAGGNGREIILRNVFIRWVQWVLRAVLTLICMTTTIASAQQNAYPQRPIRLIVPVAVGGATDIVARIVANR